MKHQRLVQQAASVGQAAETSDQRDGVLKAKLTMQENLPRAATKSEYAPMEYVLPIF